MKKVLFGLLVLILVAGPMLSCAPAGPAEKPEDFYKDKTVRWIITTKAGGDHDLLCRLTAPYLKEYLGARAVVLENVDEAGGTVGMNMLWGGPQDGLTIASRTLQSTVNSEVIGEAGVKYKSEKFNAIVAMTSEIGEFLAVSAKGPYKSIEDLKAKPVVKMGGTEGKSLAAAYLAELLGLNAKITPGVATGDARLALLRGEIDFFIEAPGGMATRLKSGENLALVGSLDERHVAAPDVPAVTELVKLSAQQKKWLELMKLQDSGKFVFVGPEVPKDIVEYLRDVFEKIMNDPRYMEERATKYQRWPVPEPWLTGDEAQKLVRECKDLMLKEYGTMTKYLTEKYYTVK